MYYLAVNKHTKEARLFTCKTQMSRYTKISTTSLWRYFCNDNHKETKIWLLWQGIEVTKINRIGGYNKFGL